MAELKYEILETLGVISSSGNWSKELSIVKWGDRDAKYDLRAWNADHTRMQKGITLTEDELKALYEVIKIELENGQGL